MMSFYELKLANLPKSMKHLITLFGIRADPLFSMARKTQVSHLKFKSLECYGSFFWAQSLCLCYVTRDCFQCPIFNACWDVRLRYFSVLISVLKQCEISAQLGYHFQKCFLHKIDA